MAKSKFLFVERRTSSNKISDFKPKEKEMSSLSSKMSITKKQAYQLLFREHMNEKVLSAKTIDDIKPLLYELIEKAL